MHKSRGHLATFASVLALAGTLIVAGQQTALAAPPAEDVVCTGCIDTSDIADSAVTGGKIADGTVGSAEIGDGAVGSAEIADGAVGSADIADWSVTGSKLAEDAVFAHVITVRSDGLPTDNCDALKAVLGSLIGTSETNRYLVRLDAGVYDCGDTGLEYYPPVPVDVPPYVTLQGAGVHATKITAAFASLDGATGLVRLGAFTELRDLTVENRNDFGNIGLGVPAIGIVVGPLPTPCKDSLGNLFPARITNVAVKFTQTPTDARGVYLGCGEASLTDVRIDVPAVTRESRGIVVNTFAQGNLENVTAKLGYAPNRGIAFQIIGFATEIVTHVTARNSIFVGSLGGATDFAVVTVSGVQADFVSTQLDGAVDSQGISVVRCVGSYDGDYVPLPADCGAIVY